MLATPRPKAIRRAILAPSAIFLSAIFLSVTLLLAAAVTSAHDGHPAPTAAAAAASERPSPTFAPDQPGAANRPAPPVGMDATLAAKDAALHTIGWRLATGNATFCADRTLRTGLLLEDAANFGAEASGAVRVRAVAPGSPASKAGIMPGQRVEAVNGIATAQWPFDRRRPWFRLNAIRDAIDVTLNRDQEVTIGLSTGPIMLTGTPACAGRFEALTGDARMRADATRVLVGEGFAGWDWPEDQLAAAIAHEAAHLMLDHVALVENSRHKRSVRRQVERTADRMIPWLLANAGYDPLAAERFIQIWQARPEFRRKAGSVYPAPDTRHRAIREEAQRVAAIMVTPGAVADWRNGGF